MILGDGILLTCWLLPVTVFSHLLDVVNKEYNTNEIAIIYGYHCTPAVRQSTSAPCGMPMRGGHSRTPVSIEMTVLT